MNSDILKVLYSAQDIKATVQRLATTVHKDYADVKPLCVCVLKGAVIFMTDFIRAYDDYLEIDFMDVSSYYGGTTSSGDVRIDKDLDTSVKGRDVIIVEDIVDTGTTLKALKELLAHRGAKSVKIVALLDKPTGRTVDVKADYVGQTVPGEFLVGYGLDYNGLYRNLPYIGVLKPEVYK
ncbi:hypoxanthine phosphoribosyltransferase [Lacticaseibacillus thailandensis]|uniref:Hypoxanthine phosphoribosyltransferase n=1 Tax=Lacticaseibacillus thailandensis DSM 22698 = JCM 13996 TaxID=1423810 RepID=A0A0R2C568_9LACO|nr:hypoxanthine phosphoribosyltransferase [Lacticaseibacillus thailandensis]KRM86647.1 hypoxanthine phosphoribosyltransferase [Lacticaseibacillus thailandensis DSM 22698 = JCM 13996]